jgi:8-oxo-dGTP pyrophosphatase MutT (NUDIX family)
VTGALDGDSEQPAIRRVEENLVYQNQFATIYDDTVRFADGRLGTYLRIGESSGQPGVALLAVCDDTIALVRTYRYPVSAWEWGIPRGFAHGDDAAASARAELAEEMGAQPDQLDHIGTIHPNSGLLAGRVELFLARYCTRVSEPTDRDEVAEIRWIPVGQLVKEIARGTITDAFTLSALTCAQARNLLTLR